MVINLWLLIYVINLEWLLTYGSGVQTGHAGQLCIYHVVQCQRPLCLMKHLFFFVCI